MLLILFHILIELKKSSVPVLSVRIGDHCYYGLCDIGASSSAIPYELYREIMHEIGPCELEDIDVVIHLANKETICPIGIVIYVEVLCGKIKYPADFLVLNSAASKTCPIIFGRTFLNTCGDIIDCNKEKVLTKFDGYSYEFNFTKFAKAPCENSLPNKDFRMEQLASIDPVYDLGPLFDDCKYAHSDDKVVASDSYIVNFIQSAPESYYEIGKHGFMHLNNIKFPLFMLKVLKLHLFCFTMLVALCFHDFFLYKIPIHRKWVRLKCVLNFLLDALFYFNSYFLCEHLLKLSCLT